MLFQVWNNEFQAFATGKSLQWYLHSFEKKKPNFWELAIPCDGNLWFQVWEPAVPCHGAHVGNREYANIPVPVHYAKQTVLYRSIKQNHKIVKEMFSYHFDKHLFRAKTFLCRSNSQQKEQIFYGLSKQNQKKRTMRPNYVQSTDGSIGIVTFSCLEPWVSNFGNPQFLKMTAP